ncbi:hypothetical protein ABZP36_021446 [Zizania latifolia]
MPIALESGRGHGGELLGIGEALYPPPPAAACGGGGSSSMGWGRDSRIGLVQCDDGEESDGEVQSSYRGALDTMDALQEALPRRRGMTKFYNTKSSSLSAENVVSSSQCTKAPTSPEDPSPKKRKCPTPFSFDQDKSQQSKDLSPANDATNSPTNCKKPLYPAVTDNSACKNSGYCEHECCKNLSCDCPQKAKDAVSSLPTALEPELTSLEVRFDVISLSDVGELGDVVSPREKRRKN